MKEQFKNELYKQITKRLPESSVFYPYLKEHLFQ